MSGETVLSSEYRAHPACAVYEATIAAINDEWFDVARRKAEGEQTMRERHNLARIRATRERDEALAAQGLYVAERFGPNNEWIVELLRRDESEEVA